MKIAILFLLITLLISAVCLSFVYVHQKIESAASNEDFFFGVSFGLNSTSEAKLLIDKVKEFTNLLVINSWDISKNETTLNEICQYAVDAKMSIIIYFDFIPDIAFPWLPAWLDSASERWGKNFLGIYLYDEPGGNQIDTGQWRTGPSAKRAFENVSDYSDAANRFVTNIPSTFSMQNVTNRCIPVFTSDYALYWFDYLAGYDTVFAELGWNNSAIQQIALCRGAANVQGKQWGAIITWTYTLAPYLESGTEMLRDMTTAYRAGANYVIIFDYPKLNQYGILTEEHFAAMKQFWNQIHSFPRSIFGECRGQVAFALPKDYGWGMRTPDDKIWGFWSPDDKAAAIWNKMTTLIQEYGLKLDIIYDDAQFIIKEKYSKVYLWNDTVC